MQEATINSIMHNVYRLDTDAVRNYIMQFTELHSEGLERTVHQHTVQSTDTALKIKADVLRE
jgi:hypothetical protein